MTDAASIRDAVASVLAEAGHMDALVNNAGYGQYGAVEDVTAEEWRRQFDVNLFGAIEAARAVLPAMREKRRGTIVNVSSVAGKIAIPFAAPYCASKHALEAFSDALRVEVAPFGIRVAVIEAGPIETRFGDRARAGVARMLATPGPYSVLLRERRARDGHGLPGGETSTRGGGARHRRSDRIGQSQDPLPDHADGSRPNSPAAASSRPLLRPPDEESSEAPRPRLSAAARSSHSTIPTPAARGGSG